MASAFVALGYLIGSIPVGYLVARAKGVDIFQAGSGNVGATNVGRVLGRKFGLSVFVLDVLKGAAPTLLARMLLGPDAAVAVGLATIVGHLFPIFLRGRGGKGVATGFGVVAVLLPIPALVALLVWLFAAITTGYVSLASIAAALALALARLISVAEPFAPENRILSGFCLLAALLIVVKHRGNIVRLAQNKENQLADTSAREMAARVLHVLSLAIWFGGGAFFTFVVGPLLFTTLDSRTAGQAVAPMFPLYFALQGVCGLLALVTAAEWTTSGRVHAFRFALIAAALALVLAGWPLVAKVAELRAARYSLDETIALAAQSAFARWHAISLLLNILALALAGIALTLAAALPERLRVTDEHDSM